MVLTQNVMDILQRQGEKVLRRSNIDRTLMKYIVKRQMEFVGFIEGKSQMLSERERDVSDLSAKDEGNDAHITDPPCLRERGLVTVVQIAAYVNMIWHTMMMILIHSGLFTIVE